MSEVFYFVLLFRMAGKCWVVKLKRFVGYRSRVYWQGTVSLVTSCLLPFVRWKNVPQQVPKTSSYRTCVTFREKVVCRKFCRIKLINKSIIVKRSLLYRFNYWLYTGINLLGNQCVVTEEIAPSTLNLSLFLWTCARSESYIKKRHWSILCNIVTWPLPFITPRCCC